MRLLPSEDYMCTLFDPALARVVCMASCVRGGASGGDNARLVISAAKNVYVWTAVSNEAATVLR